MHPLDRLRETRLLPVLVLLAAFAFFLLLHEVAGILAPFLWALVTAYVLYPIVRKLERALRLPRVVVVSGLYLVFVGGLVTTGVLLGPVAVDQARSLVRSLPDSIQSAREELLDDPTIQIGGIEVDTRDINERIDEIANDAVDELSVRAVPLVLHTVEIAIQVLVYFLVTFYFLLHGDDILRQLRSLAPRRHRRTITRVGRQVNATLGAYIRGQVILFLIMSIATYIALTILDVDYAIALALATGALELIPIIGPWTAGSIAVTVAISQGHAPFGWSQIELGVAVGLTYFVLRMLEDHFVIPQLIGRIVRVHPVLVIFAILAGAHSFGMLGLLLAVPLLATAKIVIQAIYYELGNPPARRVFTIMTRAELGAVRDEFATNSNERFVLLIAPGAVVWEDLPVMQELATLAVARDTPINVVTPDSIAASIATAAGLPVVSEATLSDEVGTAETMLAGTGRDETRREFAFHTEPSTAEPSGDPPQRSQPEPQSTD